MLEAVYRLSTVSPPFQGCVRVKGIVRNGFGAKSLTLAPSHNENAGEAEVSRGLAAICRTEATAVNGAGAMAAGAGSGEGD